MHSPIGSQMRLVQRRLGSPQSESMAQSATQIFARGSQVVPNGQTCSMATHLPEAGSQRWLPSAHSGSLLQVRRLSGVQPLKFLQLLVGCDAARSGCCHLLAGVCQSLVNAVRLPLQLTKFLAKRVSTSTQTVEGR